ncbi:MAG TPA: hypothetical protein VJ608_11645 [Albitalea sp.]|nr:hypothetical protein [Albitalea sp.]
MNATQDFSQFALQFNAQVIHAETHEVPAMVEQLSIDELAVREEYSSCYTVK